MIMKVHKTAVKLMITSVMIFVMAMGMSACGSHQSEQSETQALSESEAQAATESEAQAATESEVQATTESDAQAAAEDETSAVTETEVHVAANGSDETGSGTQEAPFATVSHAAHAMPGSLILVHEGVYGPIELGPECSGSEGSPTVIRAAEGETAVFRAAEPETAAAGDAEEAATAVSATEEAATNPTEEETATNSATIGNTAYERAADEEPSEDEEEDRVCVSLINVCHISLEGLETEGGTHGITYLSTREAGENPLTDISIRNCTVHGVRGIHGINVYACNDLAPVTDLTIEGCEVYDCECGSSESLVLNGNIDGFLIAGNKIHDNNNIGIDMIGFEGWAMHPDDAAAGPDDATGNPDGTAAAGPDDAAGSRNPYDADQVRNGICRDNVVYNISTEGNPYYYEDGEYDPSAGGIYVDGGRDIEIFNNFIFCCDIGLEVATEHSPDDNELFKVSGVRVHDNVIADCNGWTGICFGGYDKDLGFTEDCEFDHNTLVDNAAQIGVQRSRNNRIHANLIIGGETGVEFNDYCREEDMVNDISGNAAAEIEDEESWDEEYGAYYSDRAKIVSGFRSLIEDTGSRFVPDADMMELYMDER